MKYNSLSRQQATLRYLGRIAIAACLMNHAHAIDTDGDGTDDAYDADPNNPKVDWVATPEKSYLWIEIPDAPAGYKAVDMNSHGHVLFDLEDKSSLSLYQKQNIPTGKICIPTISGPGRWTDLYFKPSPFSLRVYFHDTAEVKPLSIPLPMMDNADPYDGVSHDLGFRYAAIGDDGSVMADVDYGYHEHGGTIEDPIVGSSGSRYVFRWRASNYGVCYLYGDDRGYQNDELAWSTNSAVGYQTLDSPIPGYNPLVSEMIYDHINTSGSTTPQPGYLAKAPTYLAPVTTYQIQASRPDGSDINLDSYLPAIYHTGGGRVMFLKETTTSGNVYSVARAGESGVTDLTYGWSLFDIPDGSGGTNRWGVVRPNGWNYRITDTAEISMDIYSVMQMDTLGTGIGDGYGLRYIWRNGTWRNLGEMVVNWSFLPAGLNLNKIGRTGVIWASNGSVDGILRPNPLTSEAVPLADGQVVEWQTRGNGFTVPSRVTDRTGSPLPGVIAVSKGANHQLALKSDGTVWSWGTNGQGELAQPDLSPGVPADQAGQVRFGDSSTTNPPVENIQAVSAGDRFSLALTGEGKVLSWGMNSHQQLGRGSVTFTTATPGYVLRQSDGAALQNIRKISAGGSHSLALSADGKVYSWGSNGPGTSGVSPYILMGSAHQLSATVNSAVEITLPSGTPRIVDIAAGANNTSLALDADGHVWGWGYNTGSGLALGGSGPTTVLTPVQMKVDSTTTLSGVTAISAGFNTGYALLADGTALQWGTGGTTTLSYASPVLDAVGNPLTDILQLGIGRTGNGAGEPSAPFVKSDGSVHQALWAGSNTQVVLAGGTAVRRRVPKIAAGGDHSLAIRKSDGRVRSWGRNDYGQTGNGTTIRQDSPGDVLDNSANPLTRVTVLSGGEFHSVALRADGTLLAWGRNANGQLGDTTTTDHTAGVVMNQYTGGSVVQAVDFTAIGAGLNHTVALRADGTVWACGKNDAGQLGDGSTSDKAYFVQVLDTTNAPLSNCIAVGGGAGHSIALRADGSVWTWGSNGYGQLGIGSTTASLKAVQVSGLSGVVSISSGANHCSILLPDGTVRNWGNNDMGQVGDGSTYGATYAAYRTTPVQPLSTYGTPGLGNETTLPVLLNSIASGQNNTIALKNDGNCSWGWGDNGYYQYYLFGPFTNIGPTNNEPPAREFNGRPLERRGYINAIGIAAGRGYTFYEMADGTVRLGGSNEYRELGNPSNIDWIGYESPSL